MLNSAAILLQNSKYPRFRSLESRLSSYDSVWPQGLYQRPIALSAAGFFYTGRGDRVLCFHCGGGLKNWTRGAEPWSAHAQWYSKCQYLRKMKSMSFIVRSESERHAQEMKLQNDIELDGAAGLSNEIDSADSVIPTRTTDERRMCKVCRDAEMSLVFLPCGHMCACINCASQLEMCPVCRQKPIAYVKAYLP